MKISYAIAALAALSVSPVYAACTMPPPVTNIPDGTTATAAQILDAQKGVVALNDATHTYLDCIKKEHDDAIAAGGPGISTVAADKIDKDETAKNNAAVDQLNSTIQKFNATVAAYKAKNAPKSKDSKSGSDNSGGSK
jgi:hypothetical protein